jgi:branched-chain amino acid transport system ATP-binding protein
MILRVKDITVHYWKVVAVRNVSIEIEEGKIITLVGANGAGKSTILKTISGLKSPTSGEIYYRDKRIDRLPTQEIVKLGISNVPEGRRLFPYMTVVENLAMGAYLRKNKEEIDKNRSRVLHYFPVLAEREKQLAGSLSGGEQQMLAIGRALMSNPNLLLLDEPSMGLSPLMSKTIAKIISTINQEGVSILLVEQNAKLALGLAYKGYVLETGAVVLEGETKELLQNEAVKSAYLGG